MNKNLMKNLPYEEYQKVQKFTKEQCEVLARLANLKITLRDDKPGEQLVDALYRKGVTIESFLRLVQTLPKPVPLFKPHSKVAVLIANDKYNSLSKLVTPSEDCANLAGHLKSLGFITLIVNNTKSKDLRSILKKVFSIVPEQSYCVLFYAGHGCQIGNNQFMMCIDCPEEDIQEEHCFTENELINTVAASKPAMILTILDMCRALLDRQANPKLTSSILTIEQMSAECDFITAYTTQSSQAAYEEVRLLTSQSVDTGMSYDLNSSDLCKVIYGTNSQYVNMLCKRLTSKLDVYTLIKKVHEDVENACNKQKPIMLHSGTTKRYLSDPLAGNVSGIVEKLKEVANQHKEHCKLSN